MTTDTKAKGPASYFLKSEHKLGHGHANALVAITGLKTATDNSFEPAMTGAA